jgi:hypothetical protein
VAVGEAPLLVEPAMFNIRLFIVLILANKVCIDGVYVGLDWANSNADYGLSIASTLLMAGLQVLIFEWLKSRIGISTKPEQAVTTRQLIVSNKGNVLWATIAVVVCNYFAIAMFSKRLARDTIAVDHFERLLDSDEMLQSLVMLAVISGLFVVTYMATWLRYELNLKQPPPTISKPTKTIEPVKKKQILPEDLAIALQNGVQDAKEEMELRAKKLGITCMPFEEHLCSEYHDMDGAAVSVISEPHPNDEKVTILHVKIWNKEGYISKTVERVTGVLPTSLLDLALRRAKLIQRWEFDKLRSLK